MPNDSPIIGEPPKVQAVIQIVLTFDNQTLVSGNIENKILAYGMLENARDAIQAFHQANERKVQPVSLMPPGM